MSIQTLQTAFANATWPVQLNAAFLTAGGVAPPAGFDALLIRAFALGGAATGLAVGQGQIGAVASDSFTVTSASLPNGVIGAEAADTSVTLTFTQPQAAGAAVEVQIRTDLSNWTFATGFPWMVGRPFDLFNFSQCSLIFSTIGGAVVWPAGGTSSVKLTPGMTFAGALVLNTYAQTILEIANLGGAATPSPLVMSGPIDASGITDEAIYPVLDFEAPLSAQTFSFLFMTASNPFFGFEIGPRPDSSGADDDTVPDQPMDFEFGATVSTATDPSLSVDLSVMLQGKGDRFTIGLAAPEDATPLSPANIAAVAGLDSNYIAYVPAPLQGAFTSVAFQGFSIAASMPTGQTLPTITSTAVSIGTVPGFSYKLIDDPSGRFTLEITSLDLNWTVLDPGGKARQLLLFETTFTFMPTVFTDLAGNPGGEFALSIDQDFTIAAEFAGEVTLANLLPALTGGLVQAPSGVVVAFSDVQLLIDPADHTYAFSFQMDAEVDFITWNGKPLIQIQALRMALSAQTPQDKGQTTTYVASMAGLVAVGPIALNVQVVYDGQATPPQWRLQSSLAAPLDLGALLQDLFAVTDLDTFLPDFLPKTLAVNTFAIGATVPTGTTATSKYSVAGSLDWETDILPGLPIACTANLALAYDGTRPTGQEFSGAVLGTISVDQIKGLTVTIAYAFNQPGSTGGSTLAVQWEGVTGTYDSTAETITFTLNGWSLGSLITSLVQLTGRSYFSLSGPWSVLNSISLDGFYLTYNLSKTAKTTLTAGYTLSSPIDLGFLTVNSFSFARDPQTGKVLFSIDGSSLLSDTSPEWKSLFAKDPTQGQDVTKMPEVPGRGNALFDLRLLALGQHVAINAADMSTTQAVITSLEQIPSTTSGGGNPVNPAQPASGQPRYDADNNWLVATDIGLFRIGDDNSNAYSIDVMVVFNDPDLYGLRLGFNGDKIKVLEGLAIDIMCKKVTATIGVYQLELVLPGSIRQLNFGALNVTLPNIGIAIYTNGDFMFDLGFPYNMDFSVSFTIQAIVGPFPVMGSGGFYFAKLSNDTATNIPKLVRGANLPVNGTFDPVIEFGIGVQMGLGYSIDKGILSAGFSVTFFGIIQGVFAPWHPYPSSSSVALPSRALATAGDSVQADNYFWLQGQFGIQGKLYGSINFAIISASVSVSITLAVQIVYESYRAIPLSVSCAVSVSVSVKIDLGIFSFHISFSFSTTISEDMTIGQDGTAPWDIPAPGHAAMLAAPASLRAPAGARTLLRAAPVQLSFSAPPRSAAAPAATLTIVLAPQFTVLAPDVTQLSLADQQGAFVALFSMDAPTAGGTGNATGSSFAALCDALLPWVILSHPDAGAGPVSVDVLKAILATLADPAQQPALATGDILQFLQASFTVDLVTKPSKPQQEALQAGAVIFPAIPGLTLTVPSPVTAGDTVTIDFETWTQITPAYRTGLIAAFAALAATLNNEVNPSAAKAVSASTTPESLAQVVFEDAFAMIARQLIQAAIDCYASFPHLLRTDDSLNSIMAAFEAVNPGLTVADLVNANEQATLTGGNTLYFDGVAYAVQSQLDGVTKATVVESLTSIAARFSDPPAFTTTPAALIVANQHATNLLQAGVTVTIGGATRVTKLGDSFAGLARALSVSIDVLAAQTGLYGLNTLLLAGAPMVIATVAYTTAAAGTDSIGALLAKFGVGAAAFVANPANLAVTDIFASPQTPTYVYVPKLSELTVAQLAEGVAAGETAAQTAGMVSRFMLQGLRLPNASGLTLSSQFLYPAGQPEYGLYQLTGQQFPVTAYGSAYGVTLSKNTAALGWVQINGATGNDSGDSDLTAAAVCLDAVLNWAVKHGYNPSDPKIGPDLTLAPEPALSLAPQQFAAAGYARWTTSGMDEIVQVTKPGTAAAPSAGAGQVQPLLWRLPPALLSRVEAQQAALIADVPLVTAVDYLPAFVPATLTTDPASQTTVATAVDAYAFASRIDFQIRRLQQAAGAQTPVADSNTVLPPGEGNTPPVTELAPNVYQLIGPNPSDAILLERILIEINTLGAGIVSGMLVGYPDAGASVPGLVGHAAADVYAFITRSNLSTQANPPAARLSAALAAGGPAPINDLVNEPTDAIRLLWELSTVQSGGFSFYWDALVNGADLPSGLFDASGYATLTLVVTYAPRSGGVALGSRISNVSNAVLTGSNIDPARSTLVLVSESAPNTAKIETTDTLAAFAVRYGMTPGELARDNPGASLASGAQIPLSGLFHEVTPADVASGDIWQAVADHYSRNATPPITSAALRAYNPGVAAGLYSVLMIPSATYTAVTGDTLSGVAGYFGIGVDRLGAQAQDWAGLIAGAPALSVDPQSFSVSPLIGIGNVGLRLSRANLGSPGASTDADYGQDYMFSLYSLLDMGFHANQFFSASSPGLPFGPTHDAGALPAVRRSALLRAAATTHTLRSLRNPASRRAMLRSLAASSALEYQQALNVFNNTLINPAPANPRPNLPAASRNPYRGVGGVAQLSLRWLDLFGNQTVTPFNAPPVGYAGPLNNPPAPVAYADTLLAISQWPNVSASYMYAGPKGAPQLEITLALNTAAYQPSAGTPAPAAANDAKVFDAIYFQLNQNYDGLNVPGVSGPAVTLSLINSLTGGDRPLDPGVAAQLVGFANQCDQVVTAAAAGTAPPSTLTATLAIPIDVTEVVDANVTRLRLFLVQSRNPRLVDSTLLDVEGGLSVQTEILPFSDTVGASGDALGPFAVAMENAFVTPTWSYRVGAGPAEPDEPLANQLYSVWAVRFSENGSGVGLSFTIGAEPVFYAPRPVAQSQYSGSVVLPAYTTGKGLSPGEGAATTYTGVDLNVWCAQALGAIDSFLSPAFAAPSFIVAALQQLDPDQAGDLFDILALKATLAGTISGTILPILANTGSTKLRAAAQAELKQSLLQKLGNAAAVTSVAVVPVTDATTNEPQAPGTASPPALYGAPVNTALPAGAPNYALSPASVPLNAKDATSSKDAASRDSTLAFLFTSADPALNASIDLTLSYQLTHLQTDITAVAGIDGYRQSTWIAFTNKIDGFEIGSGPLSFPVPLRELPPPPTAQGQTGLGVTRPDPTPAQLSRWDYDFTFTSRRAAQDTLLAAVSFNALAAPGADDDDPSTAMFVALGALIACRPAIFADFSAYLSKVAPDTATTSATFVNAKAALGAWKTLVANFSTAYADWAKPPPPRSLAVAATSGPPPVKLNFRVELENAADHDPALIWVVNHGGDTTPIPWIEILPDTYDAVPVTPGSSSPPGTYAAYQYKDRKTRSLMTYQVARDAESQTVSFPGLSAIMFQSADTAIQIQRNVDLETGRTTNEAFVFTTEPVAFATPVTPLIRRPLFDLAKLIPPVSAPAPIASYLTEFFGQFLGVDGAQYVTAQIGIDAVYPLNPDPASPLIDLPVGLMPPATPSAAALGEVATIVEAWLKANRAPLTGIGARVSFEVILYSSLPGASMPLVKVSSVSVALDSVT